VNVTGSRSLPSCNLHRETNNFALGAVFFYRSSQATGTDSRYFPPFWPSYVLFLFSRNKHAKFGGRWFITSRVRNERTNIHTQKTQLMYDYFSYRDRCRVLCGTRKTFRNFVYAIQYTFQSFYRIQEHTDQETMLGHFISIILQHSLKVWRGKGAWSRWLSNQVLRWMLREVEIKLHAFLTLILDTGE
jgi:hypothetical protein